MIVQVAGLVASPLVAANLEPGKENRVERGNAGALVDGSGRIIDYLKAESSRR